MTPLGAGFSLVRMPGTAMNLYLGHELSEAFAHLRQLGTLGGPQSIALAAIGRLLSGIGPPRA